MRQLRFACLVLFLVACTAPAPDTTPKLRLWVIRDAFLCPWGADSVYLVNADGSGLTTGNLPPNLDHDPRWSSDEEWIAFDNEALGRSSIYLMRSDGRDRRQILSFQDVQSPTWSPDSMSIA